MGGFSAETSRSHIITVLCFRGLGMGLTFAPLNVFALRNLKDRQMANASGISNSLRQLSGSFSIALLTAILTVRVAHHTASGISATDALIAGVTDDFRITCFMMLASLLPAVWYALKRKKKLSDQKKNTPSPPTVLDS